MYGYDRRQSVRIGGTLFVSQSFFSAALIAMFTLMAVIATDLTGSKSVAGIPSTIITLSRAVMAFPLGLMMDRFGRRSGLTLGYLFGMAGAGMGAFAIVQASFPLLLVASILIGMSRGSAEQTRFVAAEVFPEDRRATIIGIIVFAGTIGAVGGPLLVAPTGDIAASFDLPQRSGAWLAGLVLMAASMLVAFIFLRPDPRDISRRMSRAIAAAQLDKPAHLPRPLAQIFRDPMVQLAVAAMIVGQTVMVAVMTITPVHMDGHHYGDGSISLVIMAHTLGMFGLSAINGYLVDRIGRISMILAGAVILILSVVMAPLSVQMPVLVVSLFLLGLGWNFCFVGGSSLLTDSLSTDERGRTQGTTETMIALSAGVGSFSSGFLFDLGGFWAVNIVGLVAVLALTGMIGSIAPSRPQVVSSSGD